MTNKTLHILIAKERHEQLLQIEKLLNPLTITAERPSSSAAPVRTSAMRGFMTASGCFSN